MEQRWRDHLRNNCCRVIPGLVFGRRSRTSDHDRAWGNKPPRPQLSTDGRHFLFLETAKRIIYVSSLDNTKDRKLLRNSASTAAYAAPAYVLFAQEGTLMAQGLDVDKLQLTGEAFPVADHVGIYNTTNGAFSVSGLGVIAYSFGSTGEDNCRGSIAPEKSLRRSVLSWRMRTLRYRPIRSGLPFNSSIMTCGSWT